MKKLFSKLIKPRKPKKFVLSEDPSIPSVNQVQWLSAFKGRASSDNFHFWF